MGAVKYDYTDKQWSKVGEFSEFIWDESYPPQPEAIVELTGITTGLLKEQGQAPGEVFPLLTIFLRDVDVMVAHQASFDRAFLQESLKRLNLEMPEKEWLCTKSNFDWPAKYTCHKLTHLALENFIEFRMRDMHRATADCNLLQQLIARYDFDQALAYAREPFIVVKGKIAGPWEDGGEQNGIGKSLGFAWERLGDGRTFPKTWVKKIKKNQLDSLKEKIALTKSPFDIFVIERKGET